MTLSALYRMGKERLHKAGCDSPEFDAACLAEKAWGLDRQGLLLRGNREASPQEEEAFLQMIEERANHRPLQYILGSWPFMDMELMVGEGVLAPREDTEVVVRAAASLLQNALSPLYGIDLCGGTGAVALGLCSLVPQLHMDCVEWMPQAFAFLEHNTRRFGEGRVKPVRGNVLDAETASILLPQPVDVLISNPPYVRAGEIPGLQEEVQQEPHSALDGGQDGLVFYRAIADFWIPKVKPGGVVAVEIGEEQAEDVCQLFAKAGVKELCVHQDFAGLDRAVTGIYDKQKIKHRFDFLPESRCFSGESPV